MSRNAMYRTESLYNALSGPQPVMGMDPNVNRLSLLPRYDERRGWIAPQFIYDAARALTAPGNALMGRDTSPEDALNFAGYALGTGLSASAAFPQKGRILGMGQKPGYGGAHRPPGRNYGAPAHDLTVHFPDDIYGPNAARYYAHMGPQMDTQTIKTLQSLRGQPDAMVTIYRAVPKDAPSDAAINAGDWVTVNKAYAKTHGDSALEGNYRIIESKVRAGDLYTSGDSIHEFGYDPTP